MPVTPINATSGDAAANSYATLDEYKTYWTNHLFNTTQLAATDDTITAALEWAARLMDSIFKWTGMASTSTQARQWPRTGMLSATGYALDATAVPQQLKDAQCEFAGQLLLGDRTADNASLKVMGSETTLTGIKAGSVSLQFSGGNFTTLEAFDAYVRSLSSDLAYLSKAVPDAVRQLLVPSWYVEATLKRKIIFGAL